MVQEVNTNVVFEHLEESTKKITVEQGGTRSGKTYNILIWIIFSWCYNHTGTTVSIIRQSFPVLRGSAYRDFIEILEEYGLYDVSKHNKTENTYYLNGNLIEFVSLDDAQKVRGRKRDLLYINEANEIGLEDWRQLAIRTTTKIILCYNPSMPFHWIYDRVLTREDAELFITTYKDNPFLEQEIVSEIEGYEKIDPDFWNVFGKGQRGAALEGQVYSNWTFNGVLPDVYDFRTIGLDYGFTNDPTAIVELRMKRGQHTHDLYLQEHCYLKGLSNTDISKVLKTLGGKQLQVVADSAEPKSNAELRRYGINIVDAHKPQGSVNTGIAAIKTYNVIVCGASPNIKLEYQYYLWEKVKDKVRKDERFTNKPRDAFNHLMDAIRYGIQPFHGIRKDYLY